MGGGHFLFVLPSDFEVFEFCFHPSLPKDLNPSGAFVYPKHGVG